MKSVFLGLALILSFSITGYSQTEQVITPSDFAVKEFVQTPEITPIKAKMTISTEKKNDFQLALKNYGIIKPAGKNMLFDYLQNSSNNNFESQSKKSRNLSKIYYILSTIIVARLLK